jgi:hypothetical protein
MARPITVTIPHTLGKDEAKKRISEGFDRLRQQMTGGLGAMLTFNQQWDGDRLNFDGGGLGQKITGRMDVRADSVEFQVDLPDMLAAIADKITGKLKSEGQKLLEKK